MSITYYNIADKNSLKDDLNTFSVIINKVYLPNK